jgi:hypothetical protein
VFCARIAATLEPSQISGHSALGNREAELQEFAMDLRRAPVRILNCHAVGETPNLITVSGTKAKRQTAAAKPAAGSSRTADPRCSRPFAFQHRELLPQSRDFLRGVHATPEEYADGRIKSSTNERL